ncbi:MAG: hypothetical protein Q9209_005149 [Squamulea sp. 1 TL-2023]
MQIPSLPTTAVLIGASLSVNLRLPVLSAPNIPETFNAVEEPPHCWPKSPWKLTGLLNGGSVFFMKYGRRWSWDPETRRDMNEGAGRISQALRQSSFSESQPQGSWHYSRGIVSFWIGLDTEIPATRGEVLDLFHWILALLRRFSDSIKITRAVLLDARASKKAYFSLTFPGIVQSRQHDMVESLPAKRK